MSILQRAKKYSVQILVILLIILVQCAFVSKKEGYHMDELLSFELSNAEYNPWIVPTQPVGRLAKFMHEEIDGETLGETIGNLKETVADVLENKSASKLLSYKADVYEEPVWISREQFQDYVTTENGDRFNYLSVYFNVKDDNHPPIHFMLLHTISSLMPGKVLPMMGCLINIAAVVGCAVILMRLGTLADKHGITPDGTGKIWGIAAAAMFGCSQAAVATTLLIRMYGVLTFFCLAFFYIHVRKWLEKEFDKKNLLLILVTVGGFLTQYFFLFYCLVLAFVTVVVLFVYKRRKELWIYIRSMVIAALIGVGIFPFSVLDVFASSRGVEALEKLGNGMGELLARIAAFGEILLIRCFGNLRIGLVLLLMSLAFGLWLFVTRKQLRVPVACAYAPVLGYFLLAAKLSPFYVDRYLMAAFPFVIGWFSALLCFGVYRLPVMRKRVLTVCILLFCATQIYSYDGTYLYVGYEEQLQIAKANQDLSCICLYEGSGYYDNLLEFAEYENTLLVTPKELLERKDASDVESLQKVVFVVKNIIEEDMLQEVLDKYRFEVQEILVQDGACGDDVYLCVKVQD